MRLLQKLRSMYSVKPRVHHYETLSDLEEPLGPGGPCCLSLPEGASRAADPRGAGAEQPPSRREKLFYSCAQSSTCKCHAPRARLPTLPRLYWFESLKTRVVSGTDKRNSCHLPATAIQAHACAKPSGQTRAGVPSRSACPRCPGSRPQEPGSPLPGGHQPNGCRTPSCLPFPLAGGSIPSPNSGLLSFQTHGQDLFQESK